MLVNLLRILKKNKKEQKRTKKEQKIYLETKRRRKQSKIKTFKSNYFRN